MFLILAEERKKKKKTLPPPGFDLARDLRYADSFFDSQGTPTGATEALYFCSAIDIYNKREKDEREEKQRKKGGVWFNRGLQYEAFCGYVIA